MDNLIRTMTFFGSQSAEDLYKCKENGRIYVRQPCDKRHVRWCTASKWSGGYEADSPMKKGLEIRIVDKAGHLLFTERVVEEENYWDTIAEKVAPFSYEVVIRIAETVEKSMGLIPYDEWKKRLMEDAASHGFTGDYGTWLYYDVDYDVEKRVTGTEYLGVRAIITSQRARHKTCGRTWSAYEVRSSDLRTALAICGYAFEE